MKKRTPKFTKIIYAFLALISALISFFIFVPRLKLISSNELDKNIAKQVSAILPVQKNNINGVIILRLRDGLGQFFDGDFSVSISSDGTNAVLYKDQRAFFVIEGNKIVSTSVKATFGKITKATFSPDSKFAALETKTDSGHRSFCLFHVSTEETKGTPCNNLTVIVGNPSSVWIPGNDHTFAIIDGSSMTAWNLDDTVWAIITESENPMIFTYVRPLLKETPKNWQSTCIFARCLIKDELGTSLFSLKSGLFEVLLTERLSQHTYAIYNENGISIVDTLLKTQFILDISQLPAQLTIDSRLAPHE